MGKPESTFTLTALFRGIVGVARVATGDGWISRGSAGIVAQCLSDWQTLAKVSGSPLGHTANSVAAKVQLHLGDFSARYAIEPIAVVVNESVRVTDSHVGAAADFAALHFSDWRWAASFAGCGINAAAWVRPGVPCDLLNKGAFIGIDNVDVVLHILACDLSN